MSVSVCLYMGKPTSFFFPLERPPNHLPRRRKNATTSHCRLQRGANTCGAYKRLQ